jgi:hypothetical protein
VRVARPQRVTEASAGGAKTSVSYWLFDSPAAIQPVAREHQIDLSDMSLFLYEVHAWQLEDDACTRFEPEWSFWLAFVRAASHIPP